MKDHSWSRHFFLKKQDRVFQNCWEDTVYLLNSISGLALLPHDFIKFREFLLSRYFTQDQISGHHQISGWLHFPATILFIHAFHVPTVLFCFFIFLELCDYFLLLIHKLEHFRHPVFHRVKYILLLSSININGKNMSSRANLKLCCKFWNKLISILDDLYLVSV